MARTREAHGTVEAHVDRLFGNNLPPRGRAVVEAFLEARRGSTGFVLSCGLLPEVSEACTEGLHDHVHALAEAHFDRERAAGDLRAALQRGGVSGDALDDIELAITSLVTADVTAAYVFGLAAGLGLASLDRRLAE
jgi:hypothetical protein